MTEKGIFLIFNGADDNSVYRIGWVVFDKKDRPEPGWPELGLL